MSKYYYDAEFLEGTQKKGWFRKTPPTIDLISIGIVSEDGREYYTVSKDFNLKEAWNRYDLEVQSGDMRNIFPEGRKVHWIRENVLKPIYYDWVFTINGKITRLGLPVPFVSDEFNYKNFKKLLKIYGKTNKQIAKEIILFVQKDIIDKYDDGFLFADEVLEEVKKLGKIEKHDFYSYYSAYDHVVLCWLFGKMIDLPDGFPMYTIDLKHMLDEKWIFQENKYEGKSRLESWIQDVKKSPDYPKQTNEHNALADARWNKELHEFINKLP